MDILRDRIQSINKNPKEWISYFLAAIVLIAHCYQFYDSNFRIECLIRVIFWTLYLIIVFIFKNKAVPFLFLFLAFSTEQFATFENYTSFFIISLFVILYPKTKIPVFLLYIVDVLVVCEKHNKTAIHLLIHFIGCAFIYFFIFFTFCKIKDNEKEKAELRVKPLNLTNDEIMILEEWCDVKYLKCVRCFSKNTISGKLKNARERNGFDSNEELKLKYKEEKNCS